MRKFLLSAAALTLLSGCSFQNFSEIEALNNVQPSGSPFTQRLALEYREYANTELNDMFDYPDSLHFARKGLAAASGKAVLPEPVSDWNLSLNHIQELGNARARLMNVLDLGARELMPDQAAIAQARFDCWIEQQEENWQDNHISQCKASFMEALAVLESQIQAVAMPEPAPEPTLMVDETAPMQIENAMYLVFFDFDRSGVTPEGMSIIDAVVDELSRRDDIRTLNVVGHTDTSGSQSYNQRLATRRATSVQDALVARGVDPAMISVESRGESELIVETADGVREPANRRVSISFGR